MKIYDKSAWQIDAGIDETVVTTHFKLLFTWLKEKNMLSEEGMELYELDSFSDLSLHERLLNDEGNSFVDSVYDELIGNVPYGSEEIIEYLNVRYR